MTRNRVSQMALGLSLLVHALLVAPVWGGLRPSATEVAVQPEREAPLKFRFVEPPPAPVEEPDRPTENVSVESHRASQPEAVRRPEGAAFHAGRSPVPERPRTPGRTATAAGSRAASRSPEATAARDRRAQAAEPGRDPGRADRRLTIPRSAIGLDAAQATPQGDDARLPVPEVDQRLTRATSGESFSLNTTAWDYAPYLARLKQRIEGHIFPPPAFYYGTAAWVSRVRFRIAPDGRLMSIALIDHRGVENLQYVATDAVRGAADYEPLPPGFPEPYLEITGNFYFNVLPEGR